MVAEAKKTLSVPAWVGVNAIFPELVSNLRPFLYDVPLIVVVLSVVLPVTVKKFESKFSS